MNDQKIIDFVERHFQTKKPVRTVFKTDTGTAFDDFIEGLDFGPELTSIDTLGGNEHKDNKYWAYVQDSYQLTQQDMSIATRLAFTTSFMPSSQRILQYVVKKIAKEHPEQSHKIFLWDWGNVMEQVDSTPEGETLWPVIAIINYNCILSSQLSEYGEQIAEAIKELI